MWLKKYEQRPHHHHPNSNFLSSLLFTLTSTSDGYPQRTYTLPTSVIPASYLHRTRLVPLPPPQSLQWQLFTLLLNMAKCSRAKEGKCVTEAKVSLITSATGCSEGVYVQHVATHMAEHRQISLTFRNYTHQLGNSIKKDQTCQQKNEE